MKKLLNILFIFLIFSCTNNQTNTISFSAMDTIIKISSYGKTSELSNQLVQKEIYNLESLISTTNTNSEVYKLNHSNQTEQSFSNHTVFLLDYSIKIAQKTDGAFNPCLFPIITEWGFTTDDYKVPNQQKIDELLQYTDYSKIIINQEKKLITLSNNMMIDFGGIAKGYACDIAINILKENGVQSALLDLGGNIQTLGAKPDGSFWKIGIKNPWGGEPVLALSIQDKAVVTSAGYERYFNQNNKTYIHIFDSKTGYPVENNIASVTIISEQGIYADALSTALFALGTEKAIDFYKNNKDFDFIILTKNQELIYSNGIKTSLTKLYNFTKETIIE